MVQVVIFTKILTLLQLISAHIVNDFIPKTQGKNYVEDHECDVYECKLGEGRTRRGEIMKDMLLHNGIRLSKRRI